MKVLITTSGIGSRLGDITKFTNKCLVRIGDKPAISYIIEKYSPETEFVITVGYFGKQVRDFLEIAYPFLKFTFVEVDPFFGQGSSLLYSLISAKKELQEEFVFHACDTITLDSLEYLNGNSIVGFKGAGSSLYASLSIRGTNVVEIHQKGFLDSDFIHVGILSIQDFGVFWEIAEKIYCERQFDDTLGDVEVLTLMVKQIPFKIFPLNTWYDIGSVEKLALARKDLMNSDFHVLEKLAESIYKIGQSVIKFFHDESVLSKRVERTKYLNGLVPELTGVRNNFYKYDFVHGELFANVANRSNFIDLLKWAESKLWIEVDEFDQADFNEKCRSFYLTKTESRINEFFVKKGIVDKVDIINGEEIPTIANLLKLVDSEWLLNHQPTCFHGDFILDNILLVGNGDFKLIDWRQDFSGIVAYGDKYYDIAKLAHNLVVNHDLVDQDLFQLKYETNGGILINIHRLQTLVECEALLFDYLKSNNYDVRKVELLRAIIWLNMSPLHHNPFDTFLFYFGKYNLYNVLKKYGKI